LAGRMIERGLIERVEAPGRAVQHRLTKEGTAQRRRGNEIVARTLKESFSALSTKQLAEFDHALRIILATPFETKSDKCV
jgi:hypothetical protein